MCDGYLYKINVVLGSILTDSSFGEKKENLKG
jgi:hypothetical protein